MILRGAVEAVSFRQASKLSRKESRLEIIESILLETCNNQQLQASHNSQDL